MTTMFAAAIDNWIRNNAQSRLTAGLERKPVRILDHRVFGTSARGTTLNANVFDVKVIYSSGETKLFVSHADDYSSESLYSKSGSRRTRVDVSGWELSHFLQLLYRNDPAALGFVYSPIIEDTEFVAELRRIAALCFDPQVAFREHVLSAKANVSLLPRIANKDLLYFSSILLEAIHYHNCALYIADSLLPPSPNIVETARMCAYRNPSAYQDVEIITNLITARSVTKPVRKLELAYSEARKHLAQLGCNLVSKSSNISNPANALYAGNLQIAANLCGKFLSRYNCVE